MSLCGCQWRAKCEHGDGACSEFADLSVWQTAWRTRPAGPKFMCEWHALEFASTKSIPGIDRPERASDFWRPSFSDMIRQADIEIRREQAKQQVAIAGPERERRYTPLQRASLQRLREIQRRT